MIPFFRKIRKQFADDNKPLQYLRYAIGEIILVVIGILIAIQINNWNEQRKSNHLKDVYLTRLINDIERDTVTINNIRTDIELNQNLIGELTKNISTETNLISLDTIISRFFESGWIIYEFIPNDNTYTDLSQTGNMNIIKNTDLIDEIIQYYGYVQEVDNSNNVNKNWITPLDLEVAKITSAFELDPITSGLFSHKNRTEAIKNIQANSELIERNAAGHYWINESLSENLLALKGVCNNLLHALHNERQITSNY
jgi:hypothetical protein